MGVTPGNATANANDHPNAGHVVGVTTAGQPMTTPTGPDEYIDCGTSEVYDVVGADGQMRKVRIFARPASKTGGGGNDPEPIKAIEAPPAGGVELPYRGSGAFARITAVVLGGRGVTGSDIDADLFVTPGIARALRPGSRLQVPMWPIIGAPGAEVTLVLPETERGVTNGNMIFMPETGEQ